MRGFEPVNIKKPYFIPMRKTTNSAGYDFILPSNITIYPSETVVIPTNIKSYMQPDEFLQLSLRSSLGLKGLIMPNAPAVIDSDYYNNETNSGDISIILYNNSNDIIQLNQGDRIMQGVFQRYMKTNDDSAIGIRIGGIGSTGI